MGNFWLDQIEEEKLLTWDFATELSRIVKGKYERGNFKVLEIRDESGYVLWRADDEVQ